MRVGAAIVSLLLYSTVGWSDAAMNKVLMALGVVVGLAFLGMGIGSLHTMPDHASVFVDDKSRTYVAPPCIGGRNNWSVRPPEGMRQTTAGEARERDYKADDECKQSGGFVSDGRSLTGNAFVWLGVLPPARHWWDRPNQP